MYERAYCSWFIVVAKAVAKGFAECLQDSVKTETGFPFYMVIVAGFHIVK